MRIEPRRVVVVARVRGGGDLTDHGGHKLTNMRLVTIVAANDTLGTQLLDFSDHLVASQWWRTAMQEYGLGAASSVRIVGPAITAPLATKLVQ